MLWRICFFAIGSLCCLSAGEGEARFLTNERQLVFEGRRSGEGYFSADGKALVFQSEREPGNPFYQIYVLDLESGDTTRVSPGFGKTPAPLYVRILTQFCSLRDAYERELAPEEKKRLETDPAYFGEIFLMNADGSNQKRLTHSPGYDGGPFFSPDGQRIIWRHFEENGAIADIYTMNLDG